LPMVSGYPKPDVMQPVEIRGSKAPNADGEPIKIFYLPRRAGSKEGDYMKIRINETNEVKDLTIIDRNTGLEWTRDLLGNNDALNYDDDDEIHTMSQDDFEWWEEYINDYEADEEEKEELINELCEVGLDGNEIVEAAVENELYVNELSDEHYAKQALFKELREKYKLD
jgi:hypothetical protein